MVPDDEDELENSIIDGSVDGGADFLYRNDEGQVLIIQAKYHSKDGHESAEAIGRFCDLQERLLQANEGKVKNKTELDYMDNYTVKYISLCRRGQKSC
jgi:hypothetical protein